MNTSTKKANEKPWQRVLLVRVAFGVAIVGMLFGVLICCYAGWHKNSPLFMAGWFCVAPCIFFVFLTVSSLSVFQSDYSWLGRLIPATAPSDWRPVASKFSGTNFANNLHGPAIFEFGPGGIRVQFLVYRAVFIPSRQVVSVSNDSWGYVRIDHTSPEIRSPIYIYSSVALEMERCMPELSLVRS